MSERRTRAPEGVTMIESLRQGLHDAMAADERVVVMGEDVGRLGGVFRVTDGLLDAYGPERVIDTPLAEAGLVGVALGMALRGYRPVVEIQFDGFVFPALNQLLTHAATYLARVPAQGTLPFTLRLPTGGRIRAGELHGESPETFLVHRPNLRVVAASDALTAGTLLRAAIDFDEPVVFLEPKRQYRRRVPLGEPVPIQLDRARVLRQGTDAVVFAYGPGMDLALDAAEQLASDGVQTRVVDLVSLAPLDVEGIAAHAREVGRVVAVTEAVERCSVASEVVSLVAQECFEDLKAAPVVVSAPNRPYPMSDFEADWYPTVGAVVDAVRKVSK